MEEEALPAPSSRRVDGRDWLGVVGLVLLVAGVWQVYEAAAWVVLGAALLLIAWRI